MPVSLSRCLQVCVCVCVCLCLVRQGSCTCGYWYPTPRATTRSSSEPLLQDEVIYSLILFSSSLGHGTPSRESEFEVLLGPIVCLPSRHRQGNRLVPSELSAISGGVPCRYLGSSPSPTDSTLYRHLLMPMPLPVEPGSRRWWCLVFLLRFEKPHSTRE